MEKPLGDFKTRKYPSGYSSPTASCKKCESKRGVQWAKDNPDKAKLANYKSYRNNIDKRLTDIERAKRNEWSKAYYRNNPHKSREAASKKRAVKLLAFPKWASKSKIEEVYREACQGLNLHVDHIVPLQSKFVCGLHCESNLRVLTAKENMSKHNLYWPDMPDISDRELIKLAKEFYAKTSK